MNVHTTHQFKGEINADVTIVEVEAGESCNVSPGDGMRALVIFCPEIPMRKDDRR